MTDCPGLVLRRYSKEDHDAVWALHNLALNAVSAHGGNGPWDDDMHAIEQVYIASGGEFLLGELDGQLVVIGALLPGDEPHQAAVKRMRVHPDFWRRGYGRAMLIALESRARELGFRRLVLDTTTVQVVALAFYRQAGYAEMGRHTWHEYTVVDMFKDLE